jgi:hypothetical protein
MAQILPFPSEAVSQSGKSPLAYFVRIGEAHNKLSDLHAAGRLPASRVVVDSSRNSALQDVTDLRRPHYFLSGPMTNAEREAKQMAQLRPSKADAARLNIDEDSLLARLRDQSARLAKSKLIIERLNDLSGSDVPRARVPRFRRHSETSSKENKK